MQGLSYPFIIRGPTRARLVHVAADSYRNALNKVLSVYQNKYVKTQFAKRMVLIEAKAAAQKESKSQKGRMFYVTVNNHDGEVDYGTVNRAGHTTHNQYLNGKEVKLDILPVIKKIDPAKTIKQTNKQIKQVNSMATSNKSQSAKSTSAKTNKAASKKVAAKKSSSPVGAKPKGGKTSVMTVKAIIEKVRKGFLAYNENMKPLPLSYLKKMKDASRQISTTLVAAAE